MPLLQHILPAARIESDRFSDLSERLVSWSGYLLLLVTLGAVIYYDDIQITRLTANETPTIYNIRIGGLKIVDVLSILLTILLSLYLLLIRKYTVTIFHRSLMIIAAMYCYAGFVGFIYSFFFQYNLVNWVQDLQQVLYYLGYFLFTFHFVNTKKKWTIFVLALVVFMALKNVMITYKTFLGEGKIFGDWAIRASQNSEFAHFPMMFFALLAVLIYRKNVMLKISISLILFLYLFNSLIGIYRTVWVILILGTMYFLVHLDINTRRVTLFLMALFTISALTIISLIFPRFLDLAWNYKFASIFEWKIYGDRSNATRVLEIINVTDYVFRHYAFLQGMGLGAFWDDAARRLLPDGGSGFMYKTRYYTTHMLILTQFLKLGVIATTVYWYVVLRMIIYVFRKIKEMSWDRWEKCILIGLHVGFVCGYISSADFVRLFTMMGINLGATAAFFMIENYSSSTEISEH